VCEFLVGLLDVNVDGVGEWPLWLRAEELPGDGDDPYAGRSLRWAELEPYRGLDELPVDPDGEC
jgi:hypothetical protein